MKIISRSLAIRENLKYYFTGIKCKNGHLSKRRTSTCKCLKCHNEISLKYSKTEKGVASRKKYKKSVKGKAANKRYLIKHAAEIKKKRKIFKKQNPNLVAEQKAKWVRSNKGKLFWKNKRNTNVYVINRRIRDGIKYSLNLINTNKKYKTELYVGCSISFLKKHLESQFTDKINWENRSEWHIDHIKPIDYFVKNLDFNNLEVQKKCWHYSNLRPLAAHENQKKSNKLNYERSNYA